ncbi:MAG: NAD(P)-dependent oxidoreductase, partial [Alphaproteobacteria bacterium]|nr:NAD(P)-dependent oxidoreductase [Alphaproteobacteria bacterium]
LSPQFQATALALAGGEAVLAREGRRDWLYARDAAEGLLALRDAPAPVPPLVNVAPGRETTVAEWCVRLAARYPGFRWRLAAPGEAPSVDLHGAQDRRPLAVARLASLGHHSVWDLDRSFADYVDWVAANRSLVASR